MSVAGQEPENEPEIVEEPGETVTVDRDEDKTPVQGPSDGGGEEFDRKTRRANRMKEAREAAEAAQAEKRATEERLARIERENAELRGYVQGQAQRERQTDPRAEINTQITKLENEAETHLERAALARKNGDNDTYRREYSAYNAKVREAAKLDAKADIMAELEPRLAQVQQQGGGISPQHLALRDTVMREFPWIATDEGARDMVDGEINRIATSQGRRQDDISVIRQAATSVAKRLKLGGQQPPTREQQQRYNGVRGTEGGQGEGDASRVVMGPREKKLARLSYPQLEPKEAEKAWAKMVAASQSKDRGE
jgi:DNA repair exonuclease SbcCD ATPase subunit